jgi:hypothetical protein
MSKTEQNYTGDSSQFTQVFKVDEHFIMPMQVYSFKTHMPSQWWRFREAARMALGVYQPLAPALLTRLKEHLTADQQSLAFHHHFIHESSNGQLVAFTQNPDKGQRDIQNTMKLGRYLRNMLGIEDAKTIKAISEAYAMVNKGDPKDTVHFSSDPSMIGAIYASGDPSSCMGKAANNFKCDPVHPCEAYHPDDWAIAYVTNTGQPDGRCMARCMVTPADMKWYSIYYNTDSAFDTLSGHLTRIGYRQQSDLTKGKRLLRLPFRGTFITPYIDGDEANLYDDGEVLWIGDATKGKQVGHSQSAYDTGGLAEHDNHIQCYECGEWFESGDITFTQTAGQYLCDVCMEIATVITLDNNRVLKTRATWLEREQGYVSERDTSTTHDGEVIWVCKAVSIIDGRICHAEDCMMVGPESSQWALIADTIEIDGKRYYKDWVIDGKPKGQIVGKWNLAEAPLTVLETLFFKTEGMRKNGRWDITGVSQRRYNDNWLDYKQLFSQHPLPRSYLIPPIAQNSTYVTYHGPSSFSTAVRYDLKPTTNKVIIRSGYYEREVTLLSNGDRNENL